MSESEIAATINRRRLFVGGCLALVATSVAFATVGAVMAPLKSAFVLTNEQVGWIGGAAIWGFAVSQLVFSPLCDSLGMRFLLRLAFVGHLAGTVVLIVSSGFWTLFSGALIISLGNGLVEAACNPLIAALYPEDKTVRLNRFHVWFPGGVVLGGVAAYLMDLGGISAWQAKLALIFIPTIAYGYLLLREEFPATEGVSAGISIGEMFKATFGTPLMLLMLGCMAMTASTELGPNRWIPAVLQAGGIPGILVLVWISGLMAVLRYTAGSIVHRLSPTGLLFVASAVAALGLYWLSYADTIVMAFLSATVFAVGVSYFWPTMLGFVSERIPKSGALGLGMMGAVSMAVVGLITSPQMGRIADKTAHEVLPVQETVNLFTRVHGLYPNLEDQAGAMRHDLERTDQIVSDVLAYYLANDELPEIKTANALRTIVDSKAAVAATGSTDASELVARAGAILGPADNYGGRISFRYIVPFTCVLIVIFGALYLSDRKSGGYKIERI